MKGILSRTARLATRLCPVAGCILQTLIAVGYPVFAQPAPLDPDEGTLSSIQPRIPEPMVFDLIRPLGAEKGELEINSLFRFMPSDRPRRLLWAPEIEYAFLDGYGIEFEVPLENAGIDSFKGAIQGTLPGPWRNKFIHGWQGVGEVSREEDYWQLDLLYLAGVRWHRNWSAFSMTGFRTERGDRKAYAFLGNYSLFFHAGKEMSYGLETNFKGAGISGRGVLLMPQVHFRQSRYNLQAGAGWNRQAGRSGLQFGWRVSREF